MLYDALELQQGIMLGYVSSDRLLGLLSATKGRLDHAVSHFEDSLAFSRRAGYRPELAWSQCDYADALLQRNRAGDRAKARDMLEEALAISQELGMGPLMERAEARLSQVKALPRGASSCPNQLTPREVEVLQLIATGKTNQQIADTLVISLRTVANHVAAILNKTGSANRAEAATYASRHGLV